MRVMQDWLCHELGLEQADYDDELYAGMVVPRGIHFARNFTASDCSPLKLGESGNGHL